MRLTEQDDRRLLRTLRQTALGLALVVAGLTVVPVVAHGQSARLSEGIRRVDEADFHGALDLLVQAESDRLTRNDLVALLTYRAFVRFALDEREQMEADLRALAAIEPDPALPASAPPPFEEAFERVRGSGVERAALVLRRRDAPPSIELEARGPPSVVREVRLYVRPSPDHRFELRPEPRLQADRGESVEWYAELIGPASAVLDRRGSREAPRTLTGGPVSDAAEDGASVWPWALGGAVVAAAAALVVVVLLSDSESSTEVNRPILEW